MERSLSLGFVAAWSSVPRPGKGTARTANLETLQRTARSTERQMELDTFGDTSSMYGITLQPKVKDTEVDELPAGETPAPQKKPKLIHQWNRLLMTLSGWSKRSDRFSLIKTRKCR